jgi:hypothetical protein
MFGLMDEETITLVAGNGILEKLVSGIIYYRCNLMLLNKELLSVI